MKWGTPLVKGKSQTGKKAQGWSAKGGGLGFLKKNYGLPTRKEGRRL